MWRETSPGDQASPWATQDPFAAPVFGRSVWKVPEGIVLLVHLLRFLGRVLVLAVLHPIVTIAVLGPVVLAVLAGWRTAVAVVLVVLVLLAGGLGVWAWRWPGSFELRVRLPGLARWRWFSLYRRFWQPVMTMTGLLSRRGEREYLPKVRKVTCTAWADRVLVEMLRGQAPANWEDQAAALAHGFGAASCRVRMDRPGRVWLEFPRGDSLADPLPALPVPDVTDLGALPVGRCEDGSDWRLKVHGTHVLVAGVTGAGKGSIIWSTIRALLPAIRAGLVEVWAVDPKRMELSFGRSLFARYAADPEDSVALLEDAVEVMQKRADRFAGRVRSHTATTEDPFVLVVVDEVAFLTAYHPDANGVKKPVKNSLATLTSQGRSVGVGVLAALQDPRKEVLEIRNLFPDKIALRMDEKAQVDMVLGDGARDRGAYADQISSATATGAGVGYVLLEGSRDPARVRAAYVSDADIDAIAADFTDDVSGTDGRSAENGASHE
ncbi:MAG TPA: FtsK/SpoIIIE domain-containing protein [Streptosporangiaceae bacterium]|jgi:S-DNA-T family DNA segregation ATPase FtsK/SpoIIIE